MTTPLLIEIGVEELPAIPFLKELPNIEKKWASILEANQLLCNFEFFYTPRRLTLWHREFLKKQPNAKEELFGAPVAIAYKDGKLSKAGEGFLRKVGIRESELGRAMKGGKEVLYYARDIEGKESQELLASMLQEFLEALNFGKSMRWGDLAQSFIRPIRSLLVLRERELIEMELFGVRSSNAIFTHRSAKSPSVDIASCEAYFSTLKDNGVTLYQDERRAKILSDFEALQSAHNITIDIDEELLSEVVAITENPTALLGSFDEKFLRLSDEVIITSMREHQRYFPIFKSGKLSNGFVVVSNSMAENQDLVVTGNERVLKARLEDALFFLDQDLKRGLDYAKLDDIVFMDGLGSMLDKEKRELKIANYLHEMCEVSIDKVLLERAVMLSKADLLTDMVYEFTELQGLVGYYYATALGEEASVALALKEQYLPSGEESALPSTLFSAIVALSYKIDNLLALFSIGKIPTGTKDPFALRRSVNGILKIVLEHNIAFDIDRVMSDLAKEYKAFDKAALEHFIFERIYQFFSVNKSIIKAVLSAGERDIAQLSKKIEALNHIVESDSFSQNFSTFKRVANIVKDIDLEADLSINRQLFESAHEKALYESFMAKNSNRSQNYEARLDNLFSLKSELDSFFDNVMVNAKEPTIKQNRQNLIASIYKAFKEIADIKEITL